MPGDEKPENSASGSSGRKRPHINLLDEGQGSPNKITRGHGDADVSKDGAQTRERKPQQSLQQLREYSEWLDGKLGVKEQSELFKKRILEKDETIKRLEVKVSQLEKQCGKHSEAVEEISELKQINARQISQVQVLEEELSNLRRELKKSQEAIVLAKREASSAISKMRSELITKHLEIEREDISHKETLAQKLVVLRSENSSIDGDAVRSAQEDLEHLRQSYRQIQALAHNMHQTMMAEISTTAQKAQDAVVDTERRNKHLVNKYTRELQLRKRFHNELVELRGNIRVFVRIRPPVESSSPPVTLVDPDDDGLLSLAQKKQKFEFDKVFSCRTSQLQIFEEVAPLVRSVIDGFNVCIFAYGQTGSGKTYTMEGPPDNPGVNQRALQLLYQEAENSSWQYSIEASVLEIYNETIRDLLNSDSVHKMEVKMKTEGGLHVPGLVSIPVQSMQKVNKVLEMGHRNRSRASTHMNEHSSRSHFIVVVSVTGLNLISGSKTYGRLNLVDLAGSERVSKSLAEGARLKEGQHINRSLSCLGDVIHALKNKHPHVPYRNSKLTYLLQESLSGQSKTLMILQASPDEENLSETTCTLNFGQRVRSAELGTAFRRLDDNAKNTPPTTRRGIAVEKSPTQQVTPTGRTYMGKPSTVPSKLNSKYR